MTATSNERESVLQESLKQNGYRLGLDLGNNSLGFAVAPLRSRSADAPIEGFLRVGVRIFSDPFNRDEARGESNAVARRAKRQQRRMTDRKRRRKEKVYSILVQAGLLPPLDKSELGQRQLQFQ